MDQWWTTFISSSRTKCCTCGMFPHPRRRLPCQSDGISRRWQERDSESPDASCIRGHVGAGVLTCPAGRSPAVFCQHTPNLASPARRPNEGVRAYVFRGGRLATHKTVQLPAITEDTEDTELWGSIFPENELRCWVQAKWAEFCSRRCWKKVCFLPSRPLPQSSTRSGRELWRRNWGSRSAPTIWRPYVTPTSSSFA